MKNNRSTSDVMQGNRSMVFRMFGEEGRVKEGHMSNSLTSAYVCRLGLK